MFSESEPCRPLHLCIALCSCGLLGLTLGLVVRKPCTCTTPGPCGEGLPRHEIIDALPHTSRTLFFQTYRIAVHKNGLRFGWTRHALRRAPDLHSRSLRWAKKNREQPLLAVTFVSG